MSELFQKDGKQNSGLLSDGVRSVPPPGIPAQKPASVSRGGLLAYTIFALGLALFIRFFIAAPFVVSGSSMEPNFNNWDYLITDRVSYRFQDPERGDIIVFHLPQEYSRTLIKRVIGLPGEKVEVSPQGIRIVNEEHPEGFMLDEPYLARANRGGPTNLTITLDGNSYAVFGDNRKVSSDSRSWGELPRENIIGRVFLRLFPLSQIGVLPAEARYLEE